MNRKLVSSDLKQDESGHYYMDFEDLEEKIVKEKVTSVLSVQSTQSGRQGMDKGRTDGGSGDICVKHGVIVVSDEIHAGFCV